VSNEFLEQERDAVEIENPQPRPCGRQRVIDDREFRHRALTLAARAIGSLQCQREHLGVRARRNAGETRAAMGSDAGASRAARWSDESRVVGAACAVPRVVV
jgi:hypothetical protein